MNRQKALWGCLVGIIVCLGGFGQAAEKKEGEKNKAYAVQLAFEKGQTISVKQEEIGDYTSVNEMRGAGEGEAKSSRLTWHYVDTKAFLETVNEVSGGRPVKAKRTYQGHTIERTFDPPNPAPQEETTLKGKSFVFEGSGDQEKAVVEGEADPEMRHAARSLESLSEEYLPFIPAKPVQLHESWKVDQSVAKRLVKNNLDAASGFNPSFKLAKFSGLLECQLLEVRETPGGQVGVVLVSLRLDGESAGKQEVAQEEGEEWAPGLDVTITLTMSFYTALEINLTKRQLVSDSTKGQIEFKTLSKQGGPMPQSVMSTVSGPIKQTRTFSYSP